MSDSSFSNLPGTPKEKFNPLMLPHLAKFLKQNMMSPGHGAKSSGRRTGLGGRGSARAK